METEEIYNLTISPLGIGKFAVQWSEDNHISILTEKGIYIFELMPIPMSPQPSLKFCRSFLYAPNHIPGESLVSEASDWLWSCNREDLYSLLIEETVTPKLEDFATIVPKITNIAWSPQNLLHSNKCLLAIITSTGAIYIAHGLSNKWYIAYDLPSIRNEVKADELRRKIHNSKSQENSVSVFKNSMKTLQASCMVWSQMIGRFAYLVVTYCNADIVIYKIPQLIDPLGDVTSPQIVWETNLQRNSKVTTLHWTAVNDIEFIITIGYFDGRISNLRIMDVKGTLTMLSMNELHNTPDRVAVNQLLTFSQDQHGIQLLASKGSFLFLIRITITAELKTLRHTQVKGFAISGLCKLDNERALIVTEDALMFSVTVKEDCPVLTEVKNQISHTRWLCLGLTHSRNHAFFLTVASPNSTYDHLVMKEPSKLHFFNFATEQWSPSSILKNKQDERLANIWDCLEFLRIKTIKHKEAPNLLSKLFNNSDEPPLNKLQVIMWISIILDVTLKKQCFQSFDSISREVPETQQLVFIYAACNYLERLAKKTTLTENETTSINSLSMYLETYLAGEESDNSSSVCSRVREVYEMTGNVNSRKLESCTVCRKTLNDLPWKINQCPEGHIFPRCALSLLQIACLNYKSCPICYQMFHPCLDKEYGETRCLYCDVPALPPVEILNVEILSEKSLSKP